MCTRRCAIHEQLQGLQATHCLRLICTTKIIINRDTIDRLALTHQAFHRAINATMRRLHKGLCHYTTHGTQVPHAFRINQNRTQQTSFSLNILRQCPPQRSLTGHFRKWSRSLRRIHSFFTRRHTLKLSLQIKKKNGKIVYHKLPHLFATPPFSHIIMSHHHPNRPQQNGLTLRNDTFRLTTACGCGCATV